MLDWKPINPSALDALHKSRRLPAARTRFQERAARAHAYMQILISIACSTFHLIIVPYHNSALSLLYAPRIQRCIHTLACTHARMHNHTLAFALLYTYRRARSTGISKSRVLGLLHMNEHPIADLWASVYPCMLYTWWTTIFTMRKWERGNKLTCGACLACTHIDAHVIIDVDLTTLANNMCRQTMEYWCSNIAPYNITVRDYCTNTTSILLERQTSIAASDREHYIADHMLCFIYASNPTTLPPCTQGGEARHRNDAWAIYAVCTQAPKYSAHSRYVGAQRFALRAGSIAALCSQCWKEIVADGVQSRDHLTSRQSQ